MNRRKFLKVLIAGGAGTVFSKVFAQRSISRTAGKRYLPPMQINAYSTEIVLNTRRSYHSGYSGTLSDQILANILWAAAQAPLIGTSRTIYVARPDNVYLYDPVQHDIFLHTAGNHLSESNLAFEVGVACDLIEDAGTALQFAHLASHSFWTSSTNQPTCCPKESGRNNANNTWNPGASIHMVNCYGHRNVSGITNELVAVSSNGSLPDPSTEGTVLLENALANLNYGNQFSSIELNLDQLSQLAWASYGCNPHYAYNGKAGLTAASAVASYYLTGRIYIVRSEGVERYHIRLPSGQETTRDHRIETVTSGDQRPQLRSAIARLPQSAPDYFVFCCESTSRYEILEAGYCAASALVQASSIDLQGYFTADFTPAERTAIINALSIPGTDLPLFIFSAGQPEIGINENSKAGLIFIDAKPNPFREKTVITYDLRASSHVKITIYDSPGRQIKTLVNKYQKHGNHSVSWDGTDMKGLRLPNGQYYFIIQAGQTEYKKKVLKLSR